MKRTWYPVYLVAFVSLARTFTGSHPFIISQVFYPLNNKTTSDIRILPIYIFILSGKEAGEKALYL